MEPSARKRSLNSREVVPKAAPSAASGTNAVVATIVGPVTVPVKVGEAMFDLVATAVAILSNSSSISAPLTILLALPEGNESFAVKLVVFV